jgi:hypothetical protein
MYILHLSVALRWTIYVIMAETMFKSFINYIDNVLVENDSFKWNWTIVVVCTSIL